MTFPHFPPELANSLAVLAQSPPTAAGVKLQTEPSLRAALLVAVGAIPGALSRYYLTWFATRRFGTDFPYGTLFINLTGSFLIGFVATLLQRWAAPLSADLLALLAVGFLGAYTTFSTYILESSNLLKAGQTRQAWIYAWGSAVLGLLGVGLGIWVAQRIG